MSNNQLVELKENVDDSESIASDESEEITEVDEDEFDQRRAVCLADMKELESQFQKLKEAFITERYILIDQKLKEIEEETAEEFTIPLMKLQSNKDFKTKLVTLLNDYRLKNAQHIYECEKLSVKLTLQSEKQSLLDRYIAKVENEIKSLKEKKRQLLLDYNYYQMCVNGNIDEDSIGGSSKKENKAEENKSTQLGDDVSEELHESDEYNETCAKANSNSKSRSSVTSPIILTGTPFVVYSLHDYEILEDWSILKMSG